MITISLTLIILLCASLFGFYSITSDKPTQKNDAGIGNSNKTSTTEPPPNQAPSAQNRITPEQADEIALALTEKTWVWDWIEFFVPYMSEDGVKQIVPTSKSSEWVGTTDYSTMTSIDSFSQAEVDKARKAKAEKSFLTYADIDAHALMIIESTGQWEYIEPMLPYMTKDGKKQVQTIYDEKHGE